MNTKAQHKWLHTESQVANKTGAKTGSGALSLMLGAAVVLNTRRGGHKQYTHTCHGQDWKQPQLYGMQTTALQVEQRLKVLDVASRQPQCSQLVPVVAMTWVRAPRCRVAGVFAEASQDFQNQNI